MSETAVIKPNIALIGYMGTFKSSAGLLLAKRLGWSFIDTDRMIEKSAGMSISDIFAKQGADRFRDLETEQLAFAAQKQRAVISCGGGAVLRSGNVDLLRRRCVVVRLQADAKAVYARVAKTSHRPLLSGSAMSEETIRQMMAEREGAYASAADHTVDNTYLDSAQTADEIYRWLQRGRRTE